MLIRLKSSAAPVLLMVVSSIWLFATIFPLLYSLVVPSPDITHIIRAFEGREALRADLAPLAEVISQTGRLRQAVPVAAYFEASAEYKAGESHTAKTTEVSYIAWFERRSKPTIFVISRTDDGSSLRFHAYESTFFGTLRNYFFPAAAVAFSFCWLKKKRFFETNPDTSDNRRTPNV